MATSLILQFGDKSYTTQASANTIIHSLLESACAHYHLTPLEAYRLRTRDAKSVEKPIDHSVPLRLTQLKHNSKLVVAHVPNASKVINITVDIPAANTSYTVTTNSEKALADVLTTLQAEHSDIHIGEYTGVPPPETTKGYQLTITRAGKMSPVIEVNGRRLSGDELSRTMFAAGIHSDTTAPLRCRVKLSHHYTAPPITADESASILATVNDRLASSIQEITEKRRANAQAAAEDNAIFDRRFRLYVARAGMLPAPEIPDDFYDISDADSQLYAKSIQAQAHAERNRTPVITEMSSKVRADYKRTVIRVRLPAHLYMEATFRANEKINDVRRLLLQQLKTDTPAFYFYLSPPRQRIKEENATLSSLGLVPSAIVNFSFELAHEREETDPNKLLNQSALEQLTIVDTPTPNAEPPRISQPTTSFSLAAPPSSSTSSSSSADMSVVSSVIDHIVTEVVASEVAPANDNRRDINEVD